MMKEEFIICRCEEVKKEEITEVIREGAKTADEIKRLTRAGMGLCQGRTCRRLVNQIIAEETHKPIAEINPSGYRPPVRPLKLDFGGKEAEDC